MMIEVFREGKLVQVLPLLEALNMLREVNPQMDDVMLIAALSGAGQGFVSYPGGFEFRKRPDRKAVA